MPGPLDSIPGVNKVADRDRAFFTLWTKYGKWESEGPLMFEERLVQRQDGVLRASNGVVVPKSCTVLRLSDQDRREYHLDVSDIFIRDDYLKSLYDICHFAIHCSFPPQTDEVGLSTKFYNPFFNNGVPSVTNAVTMFGHPGIGKSLWLIVVLVLRVLAGCPTIYHSDHNICYIFNAAGLYTIDITDFKLRVAIPHFHEAISPQYWCLVDCNCFVPDVPYFLSKLRAFIVQAASPCSERIDWVKKYDWKACRYFMKNWSLAELIMGRTLQGAQNPCSEQVLELLYSRYAPSARMAYTYADDPVLYDQIVTADIAKLTFETLGTMLSSARAFLVEALKVIAPTSRSKFLHTKLRDQLHVHTLEEAARLYQVFVRNQYTQGSADYILDDVHDLFYAGGQWEITPMTKNKPGPVNTHLKSPSRPKKSSYMRIGYKGERLTIARKGLPAGAEFSQLAHYRFLLGQDIILQDGYYQPAPGQPTLDSFIYDRGTQTATMLQMTVATRHDVKIRCVEWLLDQGAGKVRLVAVKPPGTSLDLSIPSNLMPRIMDIFELVLESARS